MALDKTYNPAEHEADIYKLWEESGAFKPAGDPKKTFFSIILPPPNANGSLHTGHAMYTVEDILTRYHRMQQHPTLWFPGTDHAGIETQVVFERELAKQGQTRADFERADFYQQVWDFTMSNQQKMLDQMRSLGFSLDWSKQKFTLDEDIVEIVYDTFKRMHSDGLIYRANRIVNWCPNCHAAFADIEIKYQERIDPLYYVKYGPFVVATVRPEPMFADTAIAVNPKDERYQKWIGQDVEVELLWGKRTLPVIADAHVDPDFGTGVIKVTPAHDPNDWDMAQRHKLKVIQGIGTDGRLTDLAVRYAGMPVAEAREQVAHDLEERGLMDHVEMDYHHSVAVHDRCGTVIEPLVTEQWWVKVEPLVGPAIKAIEAGEITFVPARFKKQAVDWLTNLRDWNISRQIVWGIQIPVFYNASNDKTKDPYLITTDAAEAEKYYGKGNFEAEIDTFDTWFSSSQWPFATLMSTGDFDQFYPTSVMDTGRDILYLWVTRMIMMGLYRTGQVPFKTVYLHGLVQDAQGKKMSKSKGNVINPLDLTAKYGTDALRLALTIGIGPGNDGPLSDQKVEGYRNFCNKLWNVARFVLDKTSGHPELDSGSIPDRVRNDNSYSPTAPKPKALADKWILTRLSLAIKDATANIEAYQFSQAGQAIYGLLWDDFADWYLEASKVELNVSVLVYGLETILKLLHPLAPFVTEVIWQNLPWQKRNLIVEAWPKPTDDFKLQAADFENLQIIISELRNLQKELSLGKINVTTGEDLLHQNAALVTGLTGATLKTGQGSGLALTNTALAVWVEVSPDKIEKYAAVLKQKRDDQKNRGERARKLLANPDFATKASAEAKTQQQDIAAEAELLTSKLDEQITKITKS